MLFSGYVHGWRFSVHRGSSNYWKSPTVPVELGLPVCCHAFLTYGYLCKILYQPFNDDYETVEEPCPFSFEESYVRTFMGTLTRSCVGSHVDHVDHVKIPI